MLAQAYLADGILSVFPSLIYPLLAACVLYTVGVVWARESWRHRPPLAAPWRQWRLNH